MSSHSSRGKDRTHHTVAGVSKGRMEQPYNIYQLRGKEPPPQQGKVTKVKYLRQHEDMSLAII